jgi:hypothetical protein
MLPAIYLDNELALQAGEVNDIGASRHLPTKLVAKPVRPQVFPEQPFGIRLGLP